MALRLRVPVLRRLRDPLPHGLRRAAGRGSAGARATRSRWPGWPPRACSRPPAPAASRSRPGRCGARGWRPAWWPAGWSPSSSLLYVVYMGSIVVFGLGLYVGLFNGPGAVRHHRRPGDLRPAADRDLPGHVAAARRRRAADHAVVRRLGARRARHGQGRDDPRLGGRRACGTAIGLVRDREWGVLGAVAWWGFDIATLWACFHAYGPDPPPFAVIVLAYFVGHARQHAAAAGRHRRRRRRHDRRLRGVRRRRRTTRSAPSSPTVRSPSGCRRCPARSPTSSCAGASPRGARSNRAAKAAAVAQA